MVSDEMTFGRSDFWLDRAVDFWSIVTKTYSVEYSGYENVPEKGPALILSKHQSLLDIPLEGIMLRRAERYGNWVLKESLPGWLDVLGGVRYMRPDDVKKQIRKEKGRLEDEDKREYRKRLIKEMKGYNAASNEYSKWLYKQGEIIVSHPEGTRTKGEMGKMWPDFVNVTRDFSNESGVKIPIIPVGIEYAGWSGFSSRSEIYVRVGKQIDINSDDLMGIVGKEMARLSEL